MTPAEFVKNYEDTFAVLRIGRVRRGVVSRRLTVRPKHQPASKQFQSAAG